MSARSNLRDERYLEQLSQFESQLGHDVDDQQMLLDLHATVSSLLTGNGESANEIRAILQRRFEAGKLRKETMQLAEEVIDRVVTDDGALPDAANSEMDDRQFVDTTVLADEAFEPVLPVPEQDRLQVGTVLRDRFLLQEEIGGGSLGIVFKALDRRLAESGSENPYVAIKVLTPSLSRSGGALRALQQEAAKGRCLSHANIVRFIDLDREEDLYFIVMEWLDGRSLEDILNDSRSKGLEFSDALDIIKQVAAALKYAHRCGVVHADVKPGNIIMTPSGQVKLFDFGAARVRQKEFEGSRTLEPGLIASGSMAYSSMQVITGEDPVPADDVFSLGCLMYRLIAGHRVFGPRNAAEAAAEGMEPQKPQVLSPRQWSALRKALSYSRVTRFAGTTEFMETFNGSAAEPELVVDEIRYSGVDKERRFPWALFSILAILLAGIGYVGKERILEMLPPMISKIIPATTEVRSVAPGLVEDSSGVAAPVEASVDNVVDDAVLETIEIPDSRRLSAAELYVPIDYTQLPPPSLIMALPAAGESGSEADLSLREDASPAIIDLIRDHNIELPLSVRFEEVSYTGNRSPWESRQYSVSDDGVVNFVPGQKRARTTISMASDPLREPDRQVSLEIREITDENSQMGTLNLNLEDDDQRTFEAGLMPNTVAFAVSQVSVREQDSAVQIDLLRFKADNTSLDVNYVVRDVTATEGSDYIAATQNTVTFGPGQRTARILIPLVQDSQPETDEAFMLELETDAVSDNRNIFLRIAVMIRDDDS